MFKRYNILPIIDGDFNASIGINDDNNGITGKFGNPYQNDRGETLRVFLVMNNLCSTSTFFQKDNYSWCGNEENPKQIDNVFIRKEDKKRMIDCETGDPAGVMSDHYAINSKLKLAEHILKKKKNGIHHQDVIKKEKKKKKEWYKILSYPEKFQSLLSENIMISKSKTNPKNNNNKDDNINTNIDIDNNNDNDYKNTDTNTNNNTDTDTNNTDTDTNNNNNNNNIQDPYDQLSKCIKVTAEELFSGEDNIKRKKPSVEFSQKSIIEN